MITLIHSNCRSITLRKCTTLLGWHMMYFLFVIHFTVFIFFQTFVTSAAFRIMHPNTTLINKISVILINLKIINGYNFIIKLFTADLLNTESISVIINKLCTYPKLFGIYKAFIFYVKRVIVCSYNCFTVYCKMNQSVYLSDICFKNGLSCLYTK